MTFELSAELLAARDRARAVAATDIHSQAHVVDRDGAVPAALAQAAAGVIVSDDPLGLVVTVEEVAAASGAVALAAALPARPGGALDLAGLRGAAAFDDSPRAQLVLAAVTLGLGRAAADQAVEMLKAATANRGSHADAPHWVVADVATEIEGARLLIYKAARAGASGNADIAMARLLASGAATRAIDAALRIAGPAVYAPGSTLERLARDIRAVVLIHGTEERQRAQAAEGLLPQ